MIYRNALICDALIQKQCDIQIKDNVIVGLDSRIDANDDVLDCSDKIIMPRLIDFNVYPKSKTLSRKSLLSLSQKAFKGGIGALALNSDTNPKIDSEMAIEFINSINSDSSIEFLPLISSTNNEGRICDIAIMHALGGKGIHLQSNESPNTIDKIAKYAKMLDIPVFIHSDDGLGGVVNYGAISADLGLAARNPLSEIKEVAKILEVAIFYDIKAVFNAVSEKRSIELINEAKKHNPNIFCEVSIHHLLLNEHACENYNTSAKIFPPLKSKAAQDFFKQALADEKIDLLTSLQCACYNSKKEQVFDEADFGIDCMEYYFSLLFDLVHENVITLSQLSRICSLNPAKILGLESGIRVNTRSNLMLINRNSYTIDDSFLPYHQKHCSGMIEKFT